jgi:hypothetical protein
MSVEEGGFSGVGRGGILPLQPPVDDINYVQLFGRRQWPAARDAVPFLQTSAAAGRGCMLGDEHRMAAHRRLLSVADGVRGREPARDEIGGMRQHRLAALQVQKRALVRAEIELRPESGSGERFEEVFGFPQPLQPSSAVGP